MKELLKEKIYEVVEGVDAKDIGVAFSGGVDSSLLAKACKDVGKNLTLLTVGFSSRRDIKISNMVSKSLILPVFHDLIPLEELERGLKKVLSIIEFDRIVRLENCICFYYVFRLASKHGIRTVLSANGVDELFCGYNVYTDSFGNKSVMINLMKTLVETAIKDKREMDKLSYLFDVEYVCPFLSDHFVDFAMRIPIEFKIKSENDKLRKHILRKVALEVGVSKSAALRPKKAFQYSSGMHKAIRMLARRSGFKKKNAKAAGLSSEMEAYLESFTTRV